LAMASRSCAPRKGFAHNVFAGTDVIRNWPAIAGVREPTRLGGKFIGAHCFGAFGGVSRGGPLSPRTDRLAQTRWICAWVARSCSAQRRLARGFSLDRPGGERDFCVIIHL